MKSSMGRLLCFTLIGVMVMGMTSFAFAEEVSADTVKNSISANKEGALLISAENFPDPSFLKYVKGKDTDGDNYLSQEELAAVTEVNISGMGIKSLKGLAFFTSLRKLNCENNSLTELDISKNPALTELYCGSNKLKALDLSKNRELLTINALDNQLTALNVYYNTKLKYLYCGRNLLTAISVANNKYLQVLSVGANNLKKLYVKNMQYLRELDCTGNKSLTYLNAGYCKSLKDLWCYECSLKTFYITRDANLERLNCSKNQLTSLNLKYALKLKNLYCGNNKIKKLNLKNNTKLVFIMCEKNKIASLDLKKNTKLRKISSAANDDLYTDLTRQKTSWKYYYSKKKFRVNISKLVDNPSKVVLLNGGKRYGNTVVYSKKPKYLKYKYKTSNKKVPYLYYVTVSLSKK